MAPIPRRDEFPEHDDDGAVTHPVARVIRWIIDTIVFRLMYAWGALFLTVALVLLNTAWQEFSGEKQSFLDRMTEHGTVKILDSAVWILPQSGPEIKMDPDRALWHHDFNFEYLLELTYLPDPILRSYKTKPSDEFTDIGKFWSNLKSHPMFRTHQFTIKMDSGLYELMRTTPAKSGVAFHVLDAPKDAPREEQSYWGSQFDQFWVWFDMPMHALALEWAFPADALEIPVRYDPVATVNFIPETVFQQISQTGNRTQSIIVGIILCVFGLFILVVAVSMLTGEMNRYISMSLFCAVLIFVPLGSSYLQTVITVLGVPEIGKFFVEEWMKAMDPKNQAGFLDPVADSEQTSLTAIRIDAAHSRYKDVFSFFHLSKGDRTFYSFAEAMNSISLQIAQQLSDLPEEEQFRFFKILDNHLEQRREGWGEPFLEGVRNLAVDRSRSKYLRSWAISAVCDMCLEVKDTSLAEFIYQQYIGDDEEVRNYWRNSFFDYVHAPGFAADLKSSDPARIRRALEIWMDDHHFLQDVQFLAPTLKRLMNHSDPQIRDMATRKWNSRTDWEER
jgi:hypothetical protein